MIEIADWGLPISDWRLTICKPIRWKVTIANRKLQIANRKSEICVCVVASEFLVEQTATAT
jgi:hypothetical protein